MTTTRITLSNHNKIVDQHHASFVVANDWQQFCDSKNFFQQSNQQQFINNNNNRNDLTIRNESFLDSIDQHLYLRNECNKLFDEKIAKIIQKSDLEFDGQSPTLEQLIDNQNQTNQEYQRLKNKLEEVLKKRSCLNEEFQRYYLEIEHYRTKRDHLEQMIDDVKNDIKIKSSKISFRTHNNALVAMVFNNNGRLENFLIEDKESSTKEDFWNDLYEKILF